MIALTIAVETVCMALLVTNRLECVVGVVIQDILMRCAANVSLFFLNAGKWQIFLPDFCLLFFQILVKLIFKNEVCTNFDVCAYTLNIFFFTKSELLLMSKLRAVLWRKMLLFLQ